MTGPKRFRCVLADIEAIQWMPGGYDDLPKPYADRFTQLPSGRIAFRSSNAVAYPIEPGDYLIRSLVWDTYSTMERERFEREYKEVQE